MMTRIDYARLAEPRSRAFVEMTTKILPIVGGYFLLSKPT